MQNTHRRPDNYGGTSHIRAQAPQEHKLPALYLVDSIVKNLKGVFHERLEPGLPAVYLHTYRSSSPNIQRSLDHLRATWTGIFSPAVSWPAPTSPPAPCVPHTPYAQL